MEHARWLSTESTMCMYGWQCRCTTCRSARHAARGGRRRSWCVWIYGYICKFSFSDALMKCQILQLAYLGENKPVSVVLLHMSIYMVVKVECKGNLVSLQVISKCAGCTTPDHHLNEISVFSLPYQLKTQHDRPVGHFRSSSPFVILNSTFIIG
jgi:hypothetical protein